MFSRRLSAALLICVATLWLGIHAHARESYDVVVYGGTSCGVMAAVQTVRSGHSCLLISPTRHLGGMTTSGLGWTDAGEKWAIGGLARTFYQRIKQHYDRLEAWRFEKPQDYDRYRPGDDAMWTFEPHVAEAVFEQLIAEYNISFRRGERLERDNGVLLNGQRVLAITMEDGSVYHGRVFIDATYEGDLMAAAGVSYTVGREGNDEFGETLNGFQPKLNTHNHCFLHPVDPYVVAGDRRGGRLPGIEAGPPGGIGRGDHRVQAYCFRMCMSNVPENSVAFEQPHDYDERDYELLFRNFEAGDLRLPFKPDMMPNRKTDTNNCGAVSTDFIGQNYDYPEATYAEREQIVDRHRQYQEGLMWTLANHPRVPAKIRDTMASWGLAKDEFSENGHWPYELYIREARRMRGAYVMTEHDCRRRRLVDDPIGLGSYNMDSHNVVRYVTANGNVQNEGDVQVSPGGPYLISYRSIVPQRGEAENVLVPVCLSATHIAYGSIRMEPVFMVLGQSAGTAAVLAIEDATSVQDVDYDRLRTTLVADGQILDLPQR